MRIKTTTKMVEIAETKYISDDGNEFTSEIECEKYEKLKKRKNLIEKAEGLRIKKLDGLMPLVLEEIGEDYEYRWYKLQSEDDYNILCEAYIGSYFIEPASYPTTMCVETYDYDDEYNGDAYDHTLNECKKDTIKFWEKHGYKVTFEEKKDGCKRN